MEPPALELKNVSKKFDQTLILQNISLKVAAGERLAIIGPNGAGKTTLFNTISGKTLPSSGIILLNGVPIDGLSPFNINRLGLCRSFQITNVFPKLTVYENIRCAAFWSLGHGYMCPRPIGSLKGVSERVEQIISKCKLHKKRDAIAGGLAYADQRALEIGLTIAGGAKVILLDEPTAGMSRSETEAAVEMIAEVAEGKTLLMVEHDMGVVFKLATKVAVLAYGEILAIGAPGEIKENPVVQEAYLGPGSS